MLFFRSISLGRIQDRGRFGKKRVRSALLWVKKNKSQIEGKSPNLLPSPPPPPPFSSGFVSAKAGFYRRGLDTAPQRCHGNQSGHWPFLSFLAFPFRFQGLQAATFSDNLPYKKGLTLKRYEWPGVSC